MGLTMATKSTKQPFDKTGFVFNTPLGKIQWFVDRINNQLDDDQQDWPTEQETYLYMVMLNELDFCKRNNEDFVLTSAVENAIMQTYSKPTKKKSNNKLVKRGANK